MQFFSFLKKETSLDDDEVNLAYAIVEIVAHFIQINKGPDVA